MTELDAWRLEKKWGWAGVAPETGWRCCYRCGDWWPPQARNWCLPTRLCRSCKNDEKRGIWPYRSDWHRKNRWGPDGHLVRRCCTCERWWPLADYYLLHRNRRGDPEQASPECRRCTSRRVARGWSIRQMRARTRAERRGVAA